MIFGMPISWLIVELFAFILFFICMNHASKQEHAFLKILELFGFMLGAALFENVGVNYAHTYIYDVRRIVMVGSVPLEILMIEASIWYAAFNLVLKMNVPKWAVPFIVGFFGTVQDMTIDPAAVFDRYAISNAALAEAINISHPGALGNGILSGQWNWSYPGYDVGFFGIPFYNFSGWIYLMGYYTVFVMIGRWLFQKYNKKAIGFAYPFLAGILDVVCLATPVNVFLLFGKFDSTQSTVTSELVMLFINYGFAIFLLVLFRKRLAHIDMKKDGLILFGIPVMLHVFDVLYVFAMRVHIAYVPVIIVSAIHFVYLYSLYRQNQRLAVNVSIGT